MTKVNRHRVTDWNLLLVLLLLLPLVAFLPNVPFPFVISNLCCKQEAALPREGVRGIEPMDRRMTEYP